MYGVIRKSFPVGCHTGKYVLRDRTVLTLLLTGFGKSQIYQYAAIRTSWLRPKRLRSCTAPRFCRACCVSSKLSNERAAIHVRSVFIRLHSAKYRIGNEGKQKVIIPKNQLHIQKSSMFVAIVWQKRLQERGLTGQSKPQFIWFYRGAGYFL